VSVRLLLLPLLLLLLLLCRLLLWLPRWRRRHQLCLQSLLAAMCLPHPLLQLLL
jgi:hypothetical protein